MKERFQKVLESHSKDDVERVKAELGVSSRGEREAEIEFRNYILEVQGQRLGRICPGQPMAGDDNRSVAFYASWHHARRVVDMTT